MASHDTSSPFDLHVHLVSEFGVSTNGLDDLSFANLREVVVSEP